MTVPVLPIGLQDTPRDVDDGGSESSHRNQQGQRSNRLSSSPLSSARRYNVGASSQGTSFSSEGAVPSAPQPSQGTSTSSDRSTSSSGSANQQPRKPPSGPKQGGSGLHVSLAPGSSAPGKSVIDITVSPESVSEATSSRASSRLDKLYTSQVNLKKMAGQIRVNANNLVSKQRSHWSRRLILHPEKPARMTWDVVTLVFLLLSVILIPIQVAWLAMGLRNHLSEAQYNLSTGSLESFSSASDIVIDIIFMIDIVLNFFTGYFDYSCVDKGKAYVNDLSDIAKNYLKSWFLIDLVSSIPFSIIGTAIETSTETVSLLKIPKALKMLRVMRILRFSKLGRVVQKVEHSLKMNPATMSILSSLGMFLMLCHILGCAFFGCGTLEFRDRDGQLRTWLTEHFVVESNHGDVPILQATWETQYMISMYWAITSATTVGYGDIRPITTYEVTFACLAMTVGAGLYSFIVGSAASVLARLDGRQGKYRKRMKQILEFMHEYQIPDEMRHDIQTFLRREFQRPDPTMSEGMMSSVPLGMRRRIALHLYRDLISKVPFLQSDDKMFVGQLLLKLKRETYFPGEMVVTSGHVGRSVFIVDSGELDVYSNNILISTYYAGDTFGESAVLNNAEPISFSATAHVWSTVFSLSKSDILEVLKDFPESRKSFEHMIHKQWVHNIRELSKRGGLNAAGMAVMESAGGRTPGIGSSPNVSLSVSGKEGGLSMSRQPSQINRDSPSDFLTENDRQRIVAALQQERHFLVQQSALTGVAVDSSCDSFSPPRQASSLSEMPEKSQDNPGNIVANKSLLKEHTGAFNESLNQNASKHGLQTSATVLGNLPTVLDVSEDNLSLSMSVSPRKATSALASACDANKAEAKSHSTAVINVDLDEGRMLALRLRKLESKLDDMVDNMESKLDKILQQRQ